MVHIYMRTNTLLGALMQSRGRFMRRVGSRVFLEVSDLSLFATRPAVKSLQKQVSNRMQRC